MAFYSGVKGPLMAVRPSLLRNARPATRSHLLVTFKMFMITFWLFHAYALYYDHNKEQRFELEHGRHPVNTFNYGAKYIQALSSSDIPFLAHCETILTIMYLLLSVFGILAAVVESWHQIVVIASYWTTLVIFDVAVHATYERPFSKFNYYTSGLIVVTLWLYSLCLHACHGETWKRPQRSDALLRINSIADSL